MMADPLELLGAKLAGTTRRLVTEGEPDSAIVEHLRDIARGQGDVLRREAARAVGGWLGLPQSASDLRIGYLLLEAAAVPLTDAGPFLAEVDAARRRVASMGHGAGAAHGDQPTG